MTPDAGAATRGSSSRRCCSWKTGWKVWALMDRLDARLSGLCGGPGGAGRCGGVRHASGHLALGRHLPPPSLGAFLSGLPEKALVVVACGIANHDNVGGIFRNAGVFGADGVVLDKSCCDPLYRKAIRVSVGRRAQGSVLPGRFDRADGGHALGAGFRGCRAVAAGRGGVEQL
jgi:hypothetical protein